MTPWTRGEAPELLVRWGEAIAREYVEGRRANASHPFRWPNREGRLLSDVVREALTAQMANHCSYCDGHAIDAQGVPSIDHFRPKSRPEFYALACTWSNLFLSCSACNHAKREKWSEALLHGDALDYRFERYFEYPADTGALEPATDASAEERACARMTIEILDLNRAGLCVRRKEAAHLMRVAAVDEVLDYGYRFLIPLCRPTG